MEGQLAPEKGGTSGEKQKGNLEKKGKKKSEGLKSISGKIVHLLGGRTYPCKGTKKKIVRRV